MIFINERRHGSVIAAAMGSVFTPQSEVVISRADLKNLNGHQRPEEVLYGGCIYEKFTGTSVMIHAAGLRPNWLNRELLWITFHYPFVKLNCIKLIAISGTTNPSAIAFLKHLGFTLEATIADGVPGGDTIIFSMERKDCRWLLMQPRNMRRPVLGRAVEIGQTVTA